MSALTNIKNDLKQLTNSPVLICCSGGPDSIFLTHLVSTVSKQNHHVVYFNHHLRPKENKNEIKLISNLCKSLNLNVHIISLELNEKNQAHYREHRIKKIKELCENLELSTVLLGHHLNDDIETLFMQFFKGAVTNFRGIPKVTTIGNVRLIHPLLELSKKEILSYLNNKNINYCIDSSNSSDDYDRNKLRQSLKTLNPLFNPSFKQMRRTLSHLKKIEEQFLKKSILIKAEQNKWGHWIKKDTIVDSHPDLLLKIHIEKKFNDTINHDQIKKINVGLKKTTLTTIELKNYTILIDYKWILIQKNNLKQKLSLPKIKKNTILKTEIGSFCCTKLNTPIKSHKDRLCLTASEFKNVLINTVDKCPLKLPAQKKILRLHHISPIEQQRTPIVYTKTEILWIPGAYINKKSIGHITITLLTKRSKENLSKQA